jgi:hypothetical protein
MYVHILYIKICIYIYIHILYIHICICVCVCVCVYYRSGGMRQQDLLGPYARMRLREEPARSEVHEELPGLGFRV